MAPKVNRWLDLLDRAGWTALQAAAAAAVVYFTTDTSFGWSEAGTVVGAATAIAVIKVVLGQRTGTDDTGSLIGKSVIEPEPVAKK
jgi:hypothetical protein